jgi:hypothetical protein
VAFNKDSGVDLGRFEGLALSARDPAGSPAEQRPAGPAGGDLRAEIRQIILEEMQSLRAEPR